MSDNINAPAGVTIVNNQGGGTPSIFRGNAGLQLMRNNWNPEVLRTNAVLLYDEWKYFDNAITRIARERLVVTQELMSRGLTFDLPNALGVLQLVWQTSGDTNPAEITMTGLPEADKDLPDFGINSMPIPMIHKEWQLDLRTLTASRNGQMPLDTTIAEIAMRKVAEMVEALIFTGLSIATNLGTIYGLLNHPNRNTGSVTANWSTAATGANMVADIIAMIGAETNDNMYGPYMLFVPQLAWNRMQDDFKTNSDRTILERLMAISGLAGIMPTNRLTGTNILLIQLTSDVVRMINGISPTMVEWDGRGGFELNFMVFCIILPQVRADYLGQSGIAHYS